MLGWNARRTILNLQLRSTFTLRTSPSPLSDRLCGPNRDVQNVHFNVQQIPGIVIIDVLRKKKQAVHSVFVLFSDAF